MSKDAIIDANGYRLNVGIVVANQQKKLLWARRANSADAWQFPQGGVGEGEALEVAMYRELEEELGLKKSDVRYLAETKEWLSYELPVQFRRYGAGPLCVGQKQKWFLLELMSDDMAIRLDHCEPAEFDRWRWVDYWYPLKKVISFKRDVYRKMLQEFEQHLK